MLARIRKLYKAYKGSRNAKILAGNFIWLTVLKFASYAFPLITMPYVARIVGSSGLGSIAFAAAIMVWVNTVADWGFYLSAVRDLALKRTDEVSVNRIFTEVMVAKVFLVTCCALVLIVLTLFIAKFRDNVLVIFYTFLIIPGQIMEADWFYQGMEKMRIIAVLNILTRTIFTISVFVFIRDASDYVYQPLLLSFGAIISGLISVFIIFKVFKVRIIRVSFKDVLTRIKESSDIFINTLMPNLFNSFSVILLGFWGGPVYNGLYDAGNKLIQISSNVLNMLSRAFFPFLSRRIDRHDTYMKLSLALSTAIAIFLFIFAPLLIKIFFGSQFTESVIILRILSLSVIARTISDIYGKNYLVVTHHERTLRNITTVCSVLGFAIAIPLVYLFKDVGVALTVVISLSLIAFASMIYARKFMRESQVGNRF